MPAKINDYKNFVEKDGGAPVLSTNDYLDRYNQTNPTTPTNPSSTGSSAVDDYYQMAKNQEYDLLFDKEVALENAKANAMKYTQNAINAQGFGSTGYGNTLQSGIYNTYLNRASEAQNAYANNIANLNLQQAQANEDKANDRFASVTTMLQGADSVDNMNQLLTDYGYGKVENGEFVWNKEKPEGMSNDDWYQMQYYYRMQKNAFDQENAQPNTGLFDYNTHFVYYDKDGKVQRREGQAEGWNWEVDTVNSYVSSGDFENGSQIMLENNHGEKIYLTVVNGQLRYSTPAEFEKQGGYKIKGTDRTYTKVKGNQ